ncbi:MAG: bifunctional prephenate dehydrogenase/3-phosphoshikimate 1-carboxyvinyltransferase [Gammaproteobacteria bacterium]|nr:bifunctional prephenate dehydrogenase/3-phosphoshikimate 1-carboxyvinyltransferase [Gammaproteobacteria bacterium]
MTSRIAIIGLGLIGGSLAKALRGSDPEMTIAAADLDGGALAAALAEGVIDEAGSVAGVCARADVIVIAAPPLAAPALLREVAGCAPPQAVVTDVGSVKSHLLETLASLPTAFRPRFVPGHPLAGSEQSGFAASRPDLFTGRNVVLTPLAEPETATDPEAIAAAHNLWRGLGANVHAMSAARHDRILALTSHLPHLLAFAVAGLLPRRESGIAANDYAASGFADFTRLAASEPELWSEILCANRAATLAALDAFDDDLARLRRALAGNDRGSLGRQLRRARRARESFDWSRSAPAAEPAGRERCFHVQPGGSFGGRLRMPGDKSISHRAVMLGSLAEGVTEVDGFLEGEDSLHTLAAFRELGVTIAGPEDGRLRIYGAGAAGLRAPRKPLYLGNSGTAMRLLAGVLAGQGFASELRGDASLSARPMRRIAEPLAAMGAAIATTNGGTPPLRIGPGRLRGIDHAMPVASAQVKSCLLLAGLYAEGETTVREPAPCRDHTERMLRGFGIALGRDNAGGLASVSLRGGQRPRACRVEVPGDISSAAFFLVAAAITPGAAVTIDQVGVNPTRTGVISILRRMGADIVSRNERESGGEPVADIEVRHRSLRGVEIGPDEMALAIDEFPALMIAAACAEGETRVRGAAELRVKESDRIDAMAEGLAVLGIERETFADGILVRGGELGGGEIDSRGDHRIAMAFAIAAPRCARPLTIRNCANVATSFPGFTRLAREAGLDIEAVDAEP